MVRVWRTRGGPNIGNSRADDGLKVLDFLNLGMDSELLEAPGLDSCLLGAPGLDSELLGAPGLDSELLGAPGRSWAGF